MSVILCNVFSVEGRPAVSPGLFAVALIEPVSCQGVSEFSHNVRIVNFSFLQICMSFYLVITFIGLSERETLLEALSTVFWH